MYSPGALCTRIVAEVITVGRQTIDCTVSSCYYNQNGSACMASRIQVRHNAATLDSAKMEIGALGAAVATSNETLCETYIPHGLGPKPGIPRL
jgi:hypothetical protein